MQSGATCSPGARPITAFREVEMRYRRNLETRKKTDFSGVLDLADPGCNTKENQDLVVPFGLDSVKISQSKWLSESKELRAWKIKGKPGFTVLTNALSPAQQRHWIRRCLQDFTENCPNNLQAHFDIPEETNLWKMRQDPTLSLGRKDAFEAAEDGSQRRYTGVELFDKLRWITMGYHYNWTTKEYHAGRSPFPQDLFEFGADVARVFGIPAFKSEAAFVNYYRNGDTLTGHTDRSEKDFELPIISASFGHTAIFLIGDQTKDTSPVPLFLRSGDIVIMEGESRTAFHGVPRIVEGTFPDYLKTGDPSDDVMLYAENLRVNMNVRQVFTDPRPNPGA